MRKIFVFLLSVILGVVLIGCTTFRASVDGLEKGEIVIEKGGDK